MFLRILVSVVLLIVATHGATEWFRYPLCKLKECCHPNDGTGYIRYEKGPEILLEALQEKVFGQPLITGPIYKSVKAHLLDESPPRPLVMYFSGWTGTGKTHVARLIATSLYSQGMRSKFVKYIPLSFHFPHKIETEGEVSIYRQVLRDLIKETVSNCDRSLIILDELDKLPSGIVDGLQPLLDYVDDIGGISYKKAIFIFLTNTAATKLNSLAYKLYKEGKERKDLSVKDMEAIILSESLNEPGGLGRSNVASRHSIGVFVPFLPLEREHLKLCINQELESQNVVADDLELVLQEIADEFVFFPNDTGLYSMSGCKGVHEKVINYIEPITLPITQGSDNNARTEL